MDHVSGHLEVTESGHGPELHMIGEFDVANADLLKQCFSEIARQGKRSAIIDMARTEFIDSATIGVLVAGHLSGLALTLRAPTEQVRRTLAIAGLGTVLNIER